VSRHPHVFDDDANGDVGIEWVEGAWEKIKSAEKVDRESVFDGIPAAMPALSRAQKIVRKIDRSGLDVDGSCHAPTGSAPSETAAARAPREAPSAPARDAPSETADDTPCNADYEQSIGNDLLSLVREAEHHGIDAEGALRRAARELETGARAAESR